MPFRSGTLTYDTELCAAALNDQTSDTAFLFWQQNLPLQIFSPVSRSIGCAHIERACQQTQTKLCSIRQTSLVDKG